MSTLWGPVQEDKIHLVNSENPNVTEQEEQYDGQILPSSESASNPVVTTNNFLPQPLPSVPRITIHHVKKPDCTGEKTFWKYTRSILYFNFWYSQFRILVYLIIGFFRFISCGFKLSKEAGIEVLKSGVGYIAGLAAILVTQNLITISNCWVEVFLDFIIGGFTVQICLAIGDALVDSIFSCSTHKLKVRNLLDNILEPIVIIGGFYSIWVYFKLKPNGNDDEIAVKKKKRHAKYSAVGNLIGSTIGIAVAIYLCLQIEDSVHINIVTIDSSVDKGSWNEYKDLYDKKNAVLALNALARIFADALAKYVEYKCGKKVHRDNHEITGTIITISS